MLYITLEEANTYFSTKLFTEPWDNATDEVKQKALNTAEENINRQRLNVDLASLNPIPENVKQAVAEEAIVLLGYGNSSRVKAQRQGVKSVRIGNVSETYKDSVGKGLLSQNAKELLKKYLVGSVPIV